MSWRHGFEKPVVSAAVEARRVWLALAAFGRSASGEPPGRGADEFRREIARAMAGGPRAAFPVAGTSAQEAAAGFLRLAHGWSEAIVPERRAILAPAVRATAAALGALIEAEDAAAAAAARRARFED